MQATPDSRTIDRSPRELLHELTHKYKNRIAVEMGRDYYLESMRVYLEQHNIHYARVPMRYTQEVYYFFFTLADLQTFMKKYEQLNAAH